MPRPIRILLVDDEPAVRRGLAMRLSLATDLVVVGEADSAESAVEAVERLEPDVVVLDVHLGADDGVEVCAAVRSATVAVVMLSIDDSAATRRRCAAAGAAAFVPKQEPASTLLAAIRGATVSDPR